MSVCGLGVVWCAGAREVISSTSGGVQPCDWVRCRTVQQLQQAVASIRQHQQQQQQQEGPWQQPEVGVVFNCCEADTMCRPMRLFRVK